MRHPTAAAIEQLNQCLDLGVEPDMQDWEIQCGGPDRASEFLDFYHTGTRNDDERFSLMALILGSFEEYHGLSGPDPATWQRISQILKADINLHRDQIEYYQCMEEGQDGEDFFPITKLMRQIDLPPRQSVNYLEFASKDLAATKEFFAKVFSWTFEDYGPDYIAFDDGKITGGFFRSENVSTATEGAPLVVFYHRDLEKTKAEIEKAGGFIKREIFSFPGGRRFHFTEPGGNELAVWSE